MDEGSDVVVTMSGPLMKHLKLTISFAGSEITVEEKDIDAGAWSEAVPVDDYATYGKGLYLVTGTATGDGGLECTAAALVKVEGNPLSSVAGAVALAMAVVGVAGVGLAGAAAYKAAAKPKRTIEAWTADQLGTLAATDGPPDAPAPPLREERTALDDIDDAVAASSGGMVSCWTLTLWGLLLTTGAMLAGGAVAGSAGEPRERRLPRAHWRPRLSLGGMLMSAVAAVGIGTLLQQFAVVYPTRSVAIAYLVIGLLTGLVIPSLTRLFGVRSVNRALADAERRLAARA